MDGLWIFTASIWVLTLVFRGQLPGEVGLIMLVAWVFLAAVAQRLNTTTLRLVFRLVLPLGSLLLLTLLYGPENFWPLLLTVGFVTGVMYWLYRMFGLVLGRGRGR